MSPVLIHSERRTSGLSKAKKVHLALGSFVAFVSFANPARAQTAPLEHKDEVRFRGGISGEGGVLFTMEPTAPNERGAFAAMGGLSGRIGAQVSNLLAFYVEPAMAMGALLGHGDSGFATTAGGTIDVDLTLANRLFLAAGAGAAAVGTRPGGELELRAGGYPVLSVSKRHGRREGLMVGVDLRAFVVPVSPCPTVLVISPMLSVGYEAF